MPPERPDNATYHVHTHSSGAEHWRHVVEIVAFIVAAGWAFYVFIYQERIKPAATLPEVETQVSLTSRPVRSGAEFVTVILDMHNIGTVRVLPAGYVINAYGFRYLSRNTETVTKSLRGNITTLTHSLGHTPPVLLQSVYALFPSFGAAQAPFAVVPGQDVKARFAFGIPRDTYDVIFLRYKYCYAKSGDTRAYDPRPSRNAQGAFWFDYTRSVALGTSSGYANGLACSVVSMDQFPL